MPEWIYPLTEKLFGTLPDPGLLGLAGLFALAIVSLARGPFADETKERLKPFIKQHYWAIILSIYIGATVWIQAQIDIPHLTEATLVALSIVGIRRYLWPRATRRILVRTAELGLLLALPAGILTYYHTSEDKLPPGNFIVVYAFDHGGILFHKDEWLDDDTALNLSERYLGNLLVIYKTRLNILPATFDNYKENIFPRSRATTHRRPLLRLENWIRHNGGKTILASQPHFYDDRNFDLGRMIRVVIADRPNQADINQALLIVAFEIMKQLRDRQEIGLNAEDEESIKKTILNELMSTWSKDRDIGPNEMAELTTLQQATIVQTSTLGDLLKRHLTEISDSPSTRSRSQYTNYGTLL